MKKTKIYTVCEATTSLNMLHLDLDANSKN